MAPRNNFRVLIIGAGATGLSVAQGLRKLNIKFSIFERQDPDTYRNWQREWGMVLHWGADFVQHWPEIKARLWKDTQVDPNLVMNDEDETSVPFMNGKTGDVVLRFPISTTRRYGKRLVNIDDDGHKITAHFEDSTCVVGDALIGCDGVKSKVREFILPPEKRQLETFTYRVLHLTESYTAEQARFIRNTGHPTFKITGHPDYPHLVLVFVANVPDENDPKTWVFQLFFAKWGTIDFAESNEDRITQIREIGSVCCEPFKSASQWVMEDTFIYPDKLSHWPDAQKWDNHGGRITMAGDSAHPMVPNRGQGLNNALEDSAKYVEIIEKVVAGEANLAKEMQGYDDEVLLRGREEIKLSAHQAAMDFQFEKLLNSPLAKFGLQMAKDENLPK